MTTHLFGAVSVPTGLDELVRVHRMHAGFDTPGASEIDGWIVLLAAALGHGPLAFMSCANEHLVGFGNDAYRATRDLLSSPSPEVVALGTACNLLLDHKANSSVAPTHDLPRWLRDVESRRVTQVSTRFESHEDRRVPWILELDFGCDVRSSATIWTNPDGSLYRLSVVDDPIGECEQFLMDINHEHPNRPFEKVDPAKALEALRPTVNHAANDPTDQQLLEWIARTDVVGEP